MDHGIDLTTVLHEMVRGPASLDEAKELSENPSEHIQSDVGSDAYDMVRS